MAQSASLAESKATIARQNLEKYVFGTAVSTVPPVVTPALAAGALKYPSYPYVTSPQLWGQGVAPISMASMNAGSALSFLVLKSANPFDKRSILHNFI
jgi:hypothetical protein